MVIEIIFIILLLSCIIMSIYSLLDAPWVSFEVDSSNYSYGLFQSFDTPNKYTGSDLKCLKEISCESSDSTSLCKISKNLLISRNSFLSFEIISIVLMILTIERLFLRLFSKPFGNSKHFLLLLWMLPMTKSIGFVLFLILSDIHISDSKIKAESGLIMSIVTTCIVVVSSIAMILLKTNLSSVHPLQNSRISPSKFMIVIAVMVVMELMFILANFFPTASYKEYSNVTFFMFSVDHKDGLDGYSISCAKGQDCYYNKYGCWILETLSSTQSTLHVLELLKNLAFLLWLESVIHIASKIRFGVRYSCCVYSSAQFVLALVELLYYTKNSNISYGAECRIEMFNNSFSLCGEMGFTYLIIGVVFSFIANLYFFVLYKLYCYAPVLSVSMNKIIDYVEAIKKNKSTDDSDYVASTGNAKLKKFNKKEVKSYSPNEIFRRIDSTVVTDNANMKKDKTLNDN